MASLSSHILVLPYPAQGHIPPLIGFSVALADRGALVTLVNIASIDSRIRERWTWPRELEGSIRFESLDFPYEIPQGYDASCHVDQGNFVQALRGAQVPFEDLLREMLNRGERVSCIVADYLWGWHVESAKKFGVSCASYWPGSATWINVHYHLPLLISAGEAPIKDGDERTISYVPGLSPTKLKDFPYYARMEFKGTLEYLMQEQEKTLRNFDDNSCLLINSAEELEPDAFQSLRKVFGEKCTGVGPLFNLDPARTRLCHSLREEDGGCIAWLDTQAPKSVLYISFGSVVALPDLDLQELSKAVLEMERPFLWVLPPEQKNESTKEITEAARASSFTRGRIVSWAPQLQVLSHASVGGFLSHCGWNSVLEAVTNGVPVLGWPCAIEQNLNCKVLVHDWKAGLKIDKAEKDGIKAAIENLMGGSWLDRAQELREVVLKSVKARGLLSDPVLEISRSKR
ncbi:UDP-glycosyltransferase 85A7 [Selaginella moellendorffii]|uniref:UDP-glycosyltransferase 85A7 n=1 Tax=Selaginella moellendorffii TaxID=88036 RepID=UPI000D1CF0F2|nr:UDP-glycosyltransferase 85A7 [Selaginella moellendorffii]|eukprot:XP_024525789.1 UDP-glycosyltransferase 85A7 [Selaginella moellendorffii]